MVTTAESLLALVASILYGDFDVLALAPVCLGVRDVHFGAPDGYAWAREASRNRVASVEVKTFMFTNTKRRMTMEPRSVSNWNQKRNDHSTQFQLESSKQSSFCGYNLESFDFKFFMFRRRGCTSCLVVVVNSFVPRPVSPSNLTCDIEDVKLLSSQPSASMILIELLSFQWKMIRFHFLCNVWLDRFVVELRRRSGHLFKHNGVLVSLNHGRRQN